MCMHMADLLCCATETNTVLWSNYTPIKIYLKKVKYKITIWSSNSTVRYISKGIESKPSNRYLFADVDSSIIHNSQKVETTQIFVHGQIKCGTYIGILSNHKKEWSTDTCYNMDEHYGKWNKLDTNRQMLYDSISWVT